MKRILFALLVFVFVFLAACSGGGKPVPVDPPKDLETIIPNPEGKDCWKKYVHQDSRHEYVTIYDQDKERTAFTIYWDNHLYTGKFTWKSNDNGKTVTATLEYDESTNLPKTATIYNYNNVQNSYIIFNGYKYYFVGYVC
jgi:hypothetical protein